jgi:hypothetical protein
MVDINRDRVKKFKEAAVFISYSHQDVNLAKKLKEQLEEQNFECFSYDSDLAFGGSIAKQVESHIQICDHFLVIINDASKKSGWVARELGLALDLRKEREPLSYPTIIGVTDAPEFPSIVLRPRHWDGSPLGQDYDFGETRCFSSANEDSQSLISFLLPHFTIIRDTEGQEGELLRASFILYEQLFPDEAERDDPLDIETWIDQNLDAMKGGDPWREIYGVLHIGERPIGMTYITGHLERKWCFGNYFGVSLSDRQKGRARIMFNLVMDEIKREIPGVKGILFEIDPLDLNFLKKAAELENLVGHSEREALLKNLRNLKRLYLYQKIAGAVMLKSAEGLPLKYWSPALDEQYKPSNERELILMLFLMENMNVGSIQLDDVLDFIYDDLYPSINRESVGYRSYCSQVKVRVAEAAKEGWVIDKLEIPKEIRKLILRAEYEFPKGELLL